MKVAGSAVGNPQEVYRGPYRPSAQSTCVGFEWEIDLDELIPRSIDDLGSFRVIDAALVGGDANDGSVFLM